MYVYTHSGIQDLCNRISRKLYQLDWRAAEA